MTREQAVWAAQHDWCSGMGETINADGSREYTIYVLSCTRTKDGDWMLHTERFNDYQQLREWAGY